MNLRRSSIENATSRIDQRDLKSSSQNSIVSVHLSVFPQMKLRKSAQTRTRQKCTYERLVPSTKCPNQRCLQYCRLYKIQYEALSKPVIPNMPIYLAICSELKCRCALDYESVRHIYCCHCLDFCQDLGIWSRSQLANISNLRNFL